MTGEATPNPEIRGSNTNEYVPVRYMDVMGEESLRESVSESLAMPGLSPRITTKCLSTAMSAFRAVRITTYHDIISPRAEGESAFAPFFCIDLLVSSSIFPSLQLPTPVTRSNIVLVVRILTNRVDAKRRELSISSAKTPPVSCLRTAYGVARAQRRAAAASGSLLSRNFRRRLSVRRLK